MSLFDLSSVVLQLASHTITITRLSPDAYGVDGLALPRTQTTFTARASVQPSSGADLKRLPEGVHTGDMVTVWTAAELLMRDRITVPGAGDFEIEQLNAWAPNGAFTRAMARKIQAGES